MPCSLTRYPQFCWTYLICNDTHLQFQILYLYSYHICNSIVICTMCCPTITITLNVVKQKHQTLVNALQVLYTYIVFTYLYQFTALNPLERDLFQYCLKASCISINYARNVVVQSNIICISTQTLFQIKYMTFM